MTAVSAGSGSAEASVIAGRTRAMLVCGALAGPLFVGLVLTQSLTRAGFDPAVHPLSLLSLGELGWIQVGNFVLSGLLAIAGAAGVRRVLGSSPAGRWGPILFGAFGSALIWGGLFRADPADGFPPGVAAPADASWQGILHSFAPAVAGMALTVACVVFARRFARLRERGWLAYSLGTATVYLALSSAAFAVADFRLMLIGGSLLWLWPSVVQFRLLSRGPA
ncbi:DUF998 domain-containing protein [Asanoa sp. WMMD1127]|uniref:DUF998 domain-containing protein n=1 Tax=Asanoa sp. WMMD1127 TaxID=3016107 RepID=UPI0024168F4D|nr:DUF998 domain-containing protein [Asanoa sp. WMMD1127]MDG4820808.1 DUF998 domain-containing protein [Asanoa sp. WMMD1127]